MLVGKIIDGYLQSMEIEEAEVNTFTEKGWKPVDAIDSSRLRCEEGYIVRVVPYENGDAISYRYEKVFDIQKVRRDIEEVKAQIAGSDYKIIKYYEASLLLLGKSLPDSFKNILSERQALRDRIDSLEQVLSSHK